MIEGWALEGGGVCGLGHVGVAKFLEERGILDQINYFAGTSAGSMLAGLLACKICVSDIEEIMLNLDISQLEDPNWLYVNKIYKLWYNFGLNQGSNICDVYGDILEKYIGSRDITLQQIREKYGKTLIITTTSIKFGKTIYYNPDDYPDTKLVEAVRNSACYPMEFTPHSENKDLLVDGGVLNNYPIKSLHRYLQKEQIIGSKFVSKVGETNMFENNIPNNLEQYILSFIKIYRNLAFNIHVDSDDWKRTIVINVGSISSMDFDIDLDQKNWLINQGYDAAENFMTKTQ